MSKSRSVHGLAQALAMGERVFLRHPVPEDEAEFLALKRESRRFHAPWEPAPAPGFDPYAPEAFRRYLEGARTERSRRLLVCRRTDGRIVGAMNLGEIVRGVFQSAYLGYWIGEAHARRGYMREAMALLLEVAFERFELHRVEANIQPDNVASIALAKGAGFVKEGFSRRYLRIAGRWRDHERWAILVEDWRRARQKRRGASRKPARETGRRS